MANVARGSETVECRLGDLRENLTSELNALQKLPAAEQDTAGAAGTQKGQLRKVVYFGTPLWHGPLALLLDASHSEGAQFRVIAVVSKPLSTADMKKPNLHKLAAEHNIPVLTPSGLLKRYPDSNQFFATFKELEPDVAVVCGYGNFITQRYLDVPLFGFLNIHPSLLPKYRGAAPVQRAIEAGETTIGVTVHFTVFKLDAGPIVAQERVQLKGHEFADEVVGQLLLQGMEMLVAALPRLFSGEVRVDGFGCEIQDEIQATETVKIERGETVIQFDNAASVHNKVRAFHNFPGASTSLLIDAHEEIVKLHETQLPLFPEAALEHRLVSLAQKHDKNDVPLLVVTCADGSQIHLCMVQRPNRKAQPAKNFWDAISGKRIERPPVEPLEAWPSPMSPDNAEIPVFEHTPSSREFSHLYTADSDEEEEGDTDMRRALRLATWDAMEEASYWAANRVEEYQSLQRDADWAGKGEDEEDNAGTGTENVGTGQAAFVENREASLSSLLHYSSLLHDTIDEMIAIIRSGSWSDEQKQQHLTLFLLRALADQELQQCFEAAEGYWDPLHAVFHGTSHWESVIARLEALQMRRSWAGLAASPGQGDIEPTDVFSIGIDVGGTNTDAVLLQTRHATVTVMASVKTATTHDVVTGIRNALRILLVNHELPRERVGCVFLGTTKFLNAIVQRKDLLPVGVVRLCGPTTRDHQPLIEWPDDLKDVVLRGKWLVHGGYEFYPQCEISPLVEKEFTSIALQLQSQRPEARPAEIVVSGVHAPLRTDQEKAACKLLQTALASHGLSQIRVTGSCEAVGRRLGLLQRENGAVLNASLRKCATDMVIALQTTLSEAGLAYARPYFTTTDGTVLDSEQCTQHPVQCIASGPANSTRGAGVLLNDSEAASIFVVDVGGTTTDVGALVGKGSQRQLKERYGENRVAGVRTNNRVGDVISIALGGGSVVKADGHVRSVGGVGHNLRQQALCCGGKTATFTDLALVCLAATQQKLDDSWCTVQGAALQKGLMDCTQCSLEQLQASYKRQLQRVTDAISKLKLSAENNGVRVVLVGGGAALIDRGTIAGLLGLEASAVVTVPHGHVANACGAGMGQVCAEFDDTTEMPEGEGGARVKALRERVMLMAEDKGGVPGSAVVTREEVTPMAFVPGNTRRVYMKAVAALRIDPGALRDVKRSSEPSASVTYTNKHTRVQLQHTSDILDIFLPPPPAERTVDADGVWTVSEYDVHCLAVGCGILGCGGGGSTFQSFLCLKRLLRDGTQLRVFPLHSIPADAHVLPTAFIGVPIVLQERMHVTSDLLRAGKKVLELAGGRSMAKTYVMTAEVGGLNGLGSLLLQAQTNAFAGVADGDLIGRAFSNLHQQTMTFAGLSVLPAALCDAKGRIIAVRCTPENLGAPYEREQYDSSDPPNSQGVSGLWSTDKTQKSDAEVLERELRLQLQFDSDPTLDSNQDAPPLPGFGMVAGLAFRPLSVPELERGVVPGSLSLARALGDAVLRARATGSNEPLLPALQAVASGAVLLARGMVEAVEAGTARGFAQGSAIVRDPDTNSKIELVYQNEYIGCRVLDGLGATSTEWLAQTPDIIAVLDPETGGAVATEELIYGIRVLVVSMRADPRLRTDAAMTAVGPTAYDALRR